MLYKLLFCVGSIIILFFLSVSYFKSLNKISKITFRQKVYKLLIILAFTSIFFDIFELFFYYKGPKIIYQISWYGHWLVSDIFYLIVVAYAKLIIGTDKSNNWKEFFISEKKLSAKNALTITIILVSLFVLFFVRPPFYEGAFEFMPFKYIIQISTITILVTIHITIMVFEYIKYSKEKNNKNHKMFITIVVGFITLITTMALQLIIPTFAILGPGLFLFIMLSYFFIENVDLIIAEELVVVKKNIEKSSNAKLDFLYNMSHDIRSPMNAIVELSKSLRQIEEFNEENVRNDIKSIKFSCNNLVEIVNNILDVNKIASGQEDLQLKEYNLNKLLADMPYVIETRIGSKPIKLEFDIDQNIASGLIGDTTKLYRVIMNILTNSVKYTEVGKIKLTIKGEINGDIQNLSMRISDTGYGIKKEDFDKMFTKFNRLDDATDNAIEGTGLGLVITKKYVDSMGGKIWFESEYGAGTIFFIELPQKIVNKTPLSQVVEGNENKKIEVIDLSNNRVLIVDDNSLNIKVTKKILEKYNIQVDSVKSGEECIFKIKSGETYNLILLDDVLPDIGGLELIKIIKNIGGFYIPPVVAYTANVMNGIKEEYLSKGFDEYMPKPFNINQFDLIIKKYCKQNIK